MAGRVISIEIGYSLTRVCEVDYKSKAHKVYEYFSIPTPEGLVNDGVLNLNEDFVEDLREYLAEYKIRTKQVMFTLSSTKIASREISIPLVKENRIMDVINASASDYFPVDLSQYRLTYSLLGVTGDSKAGQKYRVLVLAAPQTMLDGYYDLARALKLELVALDYAGNSLYQVLKEDSADNTQLVVKIEETATMVLAVKNSTISFIRSVSYGIQEALELTYRLPLKNRITSPEQAVELLSKKSFVVLDENTEESEGSGEEMSREQEFSESMTETLKPLIGAISRVVDYYTSHNSGTSIDRILLTGLGADLKGIHKLLAQQMDIPIEILRQTEGWNLEKSFDRKYFGEFVTCVGAAANPVGFKMDTEKGKGTGKDGDLSAGDKGDEKGTRIAFGVLIGGVAISLVLAAIGIIDYATAKSSNKSLQAQVDSLQEIKPVYDNYVSTKLSYEKLSAMYDATRNRNDELYEFLEELEQKMPSNAVIGSFTSDSQTVTLTMAVSTKSEAAAMIEQFRKFDSLLPDTVSVSSLVAEMDGDNQVLDYSFTIVASYRDLSDNPEEEASEEEALEEEAAGTDYSEEENN